jgi:hypothetical protein
VRGIKDGTIWDLNAHLLSILRDARLAALRVQVATLEKERDEARAYAKDRANVAGQAHGRCLGLQARLAAPETTPCSSCGRRTEDNRFGNCAYCDAPRPMKPFECRTCSGTGLGRVIRIDEDGVRHCEACTDCLPKT